MLFEVFINSTCRLQRDIFVNSKIQAFRRNTYLERHEIFAENAIAGVKRLIKFQPECD
jgi:hypothetical protein